VLDGGLHRVTSRVRSSERSNRGGVAIGRTTVQVFTEIYARALDRSQLYSDEGPPIGTVDTEPWARVALVLVSQLLR
jgi:hypothetical protein